MRMSTPTFCTSRVRDLVERLAEHAAVGLQERRPTTAIRRCSGVADELTPSVPAASASVTAANRHSRARAQRPHLRPRRARQQRSAARDERDRREHLGFAHAPAERFRQPLPHATAVPAAVQDEAHEHAHGDRREPEHVELALVELGQRRRPQSRQASREANLAEPRPRRRACARVRARVRRPFGGRSALRARARFLVVVIPRNFDAGARGPPPASSAPNRPP